MRLKPIEVCAVLFGMVVGLPLGYYGTDRLFSPRLTAHQNVTDSVTPIRLKVIDVQRQDETLTIILEESESQDRTLMSIVPLPRLNIDRRDGGS